MNDRFVNLNVCHRGDRKYLQSADIYLEIDKNIKNMFGIMAWIQHISFRKFIKKSCFLEIDSVNNISNASGLVKIKNGKDDINFIIVEGEKEKVCVCEDIDKKIEKLCQIDKELKRVSIKSVKNIQLMQIIVGSTKILHNDLLHSNGKWIASQVDMNVYLEQNKKYKNLTIEIKSIVSDIYSISHITMDNLLIGSIRFMKI